MCEKGYIDVVIVTEKTTGKTRKFGLNGWNAKSDADKKNYSNIKYSKILCTQSKQTPQEYSFQSQTTTKSGCGCN